MTPFPPEPRAHAQAPHSREEWVDQWRTTAIVWMTVFHAVFDLQNWRVLEIPHFHQNPAWMWQRTLIVTIFLSCMAVSQALCHGRQQAAAAFWRRWLQIAGAAALVTAGSAVMFPTSYITFGVLHAVAVMLLVLRGLRQVPWLGWDRPALRWRDHVPGLLLAALMAVSPWMMRHPVFDSRWLNGTGWVTQLPITQDYVPLFPWLAVVLVAYEFGRWTLAQPGRWSNGRARWPQGLRWPRGMLILSRHSLSYYLLHQPVLLASFAVILRIVRGAWPV